MKKKETASSSKKSEWFSLNGYVKRAPFAKNVFWGFTLFGVLLVIFLLTLTIQINMSDTYDLFLRKKEILNFLICIMSVCLGASFVFLIALVYYEIILPIRRSENLLKKFMDGNFSEVAALYSAENVSEIGHFIKEITTNFQEFILLIWNLTETSHQKIESALTSCDRESPLQFSSQGIEENLKSVDMALSDMKSVIRTFQLYGVDLKDERPVMDNDETGHQE